MTTLNDYQSRAMSTAIYPHEGTTGLVYTALGLAGEAGEYANKVKKILRGDPRGLDRDYLADELGDALWYVAACAYELGMDLDDIANANLKKLFYRQLGDKVKGDGDTR